MLNLYERHIRPGVARARTSMYDAASLLWRYLFAQGIWAFAHGAYDEAIRWIEPIADQIVRIGGSNAQREVFEDTLLEAYLRAGRYAQAEMVLRAARPAGFSARLLLARTRTDGEWSGGERTDQPPEAHTRWSNVDAGAAELATLERTQRLSQAS